MQIYLGMIEKAGGRTPKVHAIDEDGWLLCGGKGDRAALTSWIGPAFDVECQKCKKALEAELTEAELEAAS